MLIFIKLINPVTHEYTENGYNIVSGHLVW